MLHIIWTGPASLTSKVFNLNIFGQNQLIELVAYNLTSYKIWKQIQCQPTRLFMCIALSGYNTILCTNRSCLILYRKPLLLPFMLHSPMTDTVLLAQCHHKPAKLLYQEMFNNANFVPFVCSGKLTSLTLHGWNQFVHHKKLH